MTMGISTIIRLAGDGRVVSEVWGEEKVVVMEEGDAILEQLVQSYPVLQIERKSGQPDWKQVIKGR